MFAHGGIVHIASNMYFLYIFGDNIEDVLGAMWFTLFYLLSGIMATLLYSALTVDPDVPLVGASGAIAAVMGAYLVYFKSAKLSLVYVFWNPKLSPWVYIGLWICLNILGVLIDPAGEVAYWAHIGGFAVGLAVAMLSRAEVVRKNPHLMYLG
jgi:membrane associated rhomboid family serine protease